MEEPYRYETLPLDTPDDDPGWAHYLDIFDQGFLQGRSTKKVVSAFQEFRRDASATLGMVTTEGPGLEGRRAVAGFSSAPYTHNAGAGIVDTLVINTIAVRPSHRRRGLLSEMMRRQLTDARDQGLATAVLTASEATIYGRFGFGVATRTCDLEIDTHKFAFRPEVEVADGQIEFCDPGALEREYDQVTAAHQQRYRGAHGRQLSHRRRDLGQYDRESDGDPNLKLRAVGHWREGVLDGFAVYTAKGWDEQPIQLDVRQVTAADPAVERRLWKALADIDLVRRLNYDWSHPGDPLPLSLVDPWAVAVKETLDGVWLRVLDVKQALEQRGWDGEGDVILGVNDPMGLAEGTWRVRVAEGRAEVAPVGDEPEVSMDVSTLSRLYFGDRTVMECATAGLVHGSAQGLRRASRLFAVDEAPLNLAGF